ncbi:MAG: globin [Halieaceae bacterium]|jgi:hypothetical protein|nr:globin [Halieaceae bacterium]
MLDNHIQVVEDSINQARNLKSLEELAEALMTNFFTRYPEAEACFQGFDLREVGPLKFCKISDALLDVLKNPDYSQSSVSEEVWRHQIHQVKDKEYYFALSDVFVETIKSTLGDAWSAVHEECWNDTLGGLKHNVTLAAKEHLAAC